LHKRFIFHPIIGGNISQVISDLPSSLLVVTNKLFNSYQYIGNQDIEPKYFDIACNRRAALIDKPSKVTLGGWALSRKPDVVIEEVSITGAGGVEGEVRLGDRPDVSDGYGEVLGWKPKVFGFQASVNANSINDVKIVYRLSDGQEILSSNFVMGKVVEISGDRDGGDVVLQGTDLTNFAIPGRTGNSHAMQNNLIHYMAAKGSKVSMVIVVFLFFVSLLIVLLKKKGHKFKKLLVIELLLFSLILTRLLFYSLIQSSAWDVEARYLAATQALAFDLIVVALFIIASVFKSYFPLRFGK